MEKDSRGELVRWVGYRRFAHGCEGSGKSDTHREGAVDCSWKSGSLLV